MSGDLREQGGGSSFDFYVDKAVKRYQASNGLAPTGIVDKRTVAALNIPAESRLKQLKANLARLTEHSQGRRQALRRRQHPGGADRSGRRATAS